MERKPSISQPRKTSRPLPLPANNTDWQTTITNLGKGMTACGCLIFWIPVALFGLLVVCALIASLFSSSETNKSNPVQTALPPPAAPIAVVSENFIDPNELEPGGTYQTSKETPLMPSPNPPDPIAAIDEAMKMAAGGYFTVNYSNVIGNTIWYNVAVTDGIQVWNTWINSTALYGQDLKKAPESLRIAPTSQPVYQPVVVESLPLPNPKTSNSDSEIVYVTDTGKCYHRSTCSYLKSNRASMTKAQARSRGYSACSYCMH